jgi:AcrR family transcriptional regulator
MTITTATRRQRLRAATLHEIKDVGRRLLVSGSSPITLRAIAREMGMTPSAIYRYFPSLDALVKELRTDLNGELSAAVEMARTEVPADRHADRLAAMAHAFRRWSIAHPAEFSLMFGEPTPGVVELDDDCCETAGGVLSFCAAFAIEFVALWRQYGLRATPAEKMSDEFAANLMSEIPELRELPTEAVYAFLSGWVRLYGLVTMEVFGHLSWVLTDAGPLFETEIAAFLRQLTG